MGEGLKAAGFILAIVIVLTLMTRSQFSIGTTQGLPFFSFGFTGAKG